MVRYLKEVDKQMELLYGMRLSLKKLDPTKTHHMYLRYLHEPTIEMTADCIAAVEAVADWVSGELTLCPRKQRGRKGTSSPEEDQEEGRMGGCEQLLQKCLASALKLQIAHVEARARIIYGMNRVVVTRVLRRLSTFEPSPNLVAFGPPLSSSIDEDYSPRRSILDMTSPRALTTKTNRMDSESFSVFMKVGRG